MNKQKLEFERRKVLNKIKYSNRCGSKVNLFNAYLSESDEHIMNKFKLWLKLRRSGYDVLCEPIFENGIRMDILAFKDGVWTNYEILHTETIKQLNEKIKDYPNITVIPIKNEEDIENLEMI